MNKKLALVAVPVLLATTSVSAADSNLGISTFIGADAQWRYMDFKRDFGNTEFKHSYPQGDVYIGLKFSDYFGIQIGYESSSRRSKSVNRVHPYVSLGIPSNTVSADFPPGIALESVEYTSISRIKGPHADLVGFLPIYNGVELVASVGVANLKASLRRQGTSIYYRDTITGDNFRNASHGDPYHFRKHKTILRAMGGIQHYVTDCVGVRATVTWEQTSKFKNINSQSIPGNFQNPIIKIKDSINYGVGLFVTF